MKKKGFTLAEVLVTLGIIGVVAALTLPSLVNKHRSYVLHQQFKVAYSQIERNMNKLYFEHKYLFDDLENCGGAGYMRPHLEKIKEVYVKLLNAPKQIDADYLTANYTLSTKSKNNSTEYRMGVFEMYNLQNGMTIGFTGDTSYSFIVDIDINGYKKGPNRGGFDVFRFRYSAKNGKLDTSEMKSAITSDSFCSSDPGWPNGVSNWRSCAVYAVSDTGTYNSNRNPKKDKDYWNNLPW